MHIIVGRERFYLNYYKERAIKRKEKVIKLPFNKTLEGHINRQKEECVRDKHVEENNHYNCKNNKCEKYNVESKYKPKHQFDEYI